MSTQGDFPWAAAPGDEPPRQSWPPGEVVQEPDADEPLSQPRAEPEPGPFSEAAAEPVAEELPPPRKAPRKAVKKAPAKKAPAKRAPAKTAKKAPPPPPPPPEAVAPLPLPALEELAPATESWREVPPPAVVERRRGSRARSVVLTLLALILAAAAGFGAAAWNESKPQVYESSAALLIDQGVALTYARDEGLITKLGNLRYKYADELTTTTFANVVAPKAGVRPGVVHGSLSAQVPLHSLLLRVVARSADRALPQRIAQTAAQQLSTDLDTEQRVGGVPARNRVTLTVVSPAQPSVHIAPSRRRSVQLAAGAFGGVLLAFALLRDLTRRRTWPEDAGA